MRKGHWFAVLASHIGILAISPVGMADASSIPPILVPQITAVSSAALCSTPTCIVTASVSYNTAVGIRYNAVPDFTMTDTTNGQICTVTSVTTTPPPTPMVPPVSINSIYVRATCNVSQGDTMSLLYHLSPDLSAGWIYNLHYPRVHAKVPDSFTWIEGPGFA